MKSDILRRLADAGDHESLALVTALASGRQWLLTADSSGRLLTGSAAIDDLPGPLVEAVQSSLTNDRPALEECDGEKYFLRPFVPPVRVILVGAVHVTQSLAPMTSLAGFSVVVVDPRESWLTEFRLPDVKRMRAWPDEAFAELAPDHRTAIVTLTHDPKVDDPALAAALRSPAFYVGALGSRRTHAKRLDRLRTTGFGDEELERIHSPVGLDLGARTPSEIAVAVLAELLGELRRND